MSLDLAARRAAVLASWAGVATRFREDANAEEELVRGGLGGYADRLVVELAQNASDAAARAGVPGVVRFTYADGVLSVSNTGAPLDSAGVDGLTSLRASAKTTSIDADRAATVGRFGVGFAAVLAVSDEPSVYSRGGGIQFSAERTRAEVAALGGAAAAELARRDGAVPVLRLAWPVEGLPPVGFDTEVRLPVRADAVELVRTLLADVSPTLLFAFPGLTRVEIDGRVIERVPSTGNTTTENTITLASDGAVTTWLVAADEGSVPPELLAERPLEERVALASYSTLAAVPLDGGALVGDAVLHAPSPTDEPLSLPVYLAATFPLEVSRRRVAPGALADWLAARAADTVVSLVAAAPPAVETLALVPRPGLGKAPVDAAICSRVLSGLRDTPFLPLENVPDEASREGLPWGEEDLALLTDAFADAFGVGEEGEAAAAPPAAGGGSAAVWDRVAPREAVTLVGELAPSADLLVGALAGVVPGLLPADWAGRAAAHALDALGVRRLGVADVVEAVAGLDRPARWWGDLYHALEPSSRDLDALSALPVPLTDGRTVTGARGTLLPGPDLAAIASDTLEPLGLRVVHPDAVGSDLLIRLGAREATVATILADDRVRAAVADSVEAEDPEPLVNAILALVAAAGVRPGEEPWLAELALPADDDWYPAGELVVPGSPLVRVLAGMNTDDAPFGVVDEDFANDVLAAHGPDVLPAIGCLTTFTVLEADDLDLVDLVDLDAEDADLDLDGLADWADAVIETIDPTGTVGAPPGTRIERFRAIRDLDLVDQDQWPAALELLASGPPREVLDATAHAVTPDGTRYEIESYSRWWLAREPVLDGHAPGELRTPDAVDLEGLYEVAPTDVDPALLPLLGCRTGLLDAIAADPADLLQRLADADRTAAPWIVPLVYARIAEALAGARVQAPARVRVAPDAVADADQIAILDQPWRIDALEGRAPILGGDDPVSVAELLDAPLVSEL
ncbi:sacsin N-terminal ATP-binding-like domain-containing protein [Cryptosporangium sp. NPDC048952]|uniref:sacsin N-terminal ATP-binding-like domain-containing protein n=1 Tax=Cryptosporangium sp. NPDC048952 TaxID=3363961 RepID=UPI00371E1381